MGGRSGRTRGAARDTFPQLIERVRQVVGEHAWGESLLSIDEELDEIDVLMRKTLATEDPLPQQLQRDADGIWRLLEVIRAMIDRRAEPWPRRDMGLARIIRKGSDFGSQDGVIVSRPKDRTLPLSSAGHVGRKIGRMARCERPAGQLRRGRSREAR